MNKTKLVMKMGAFSKKDLIALQSKPLEEKQQISLARIGEWFNYWEHEVYVAFSGGKDSTVLADLCAKWCYVIRKPLYLCFVDTGLEYPEIRNHVKFFADWLRNKYGIEVILDIVRPKMRFDQVITEYGYPIISKEVSSTIRGARSNILNGVYSLRLCKLGVTTGEYGGLYDSGEYNYAGSLENSKFKAHKWKPLIDVDCDISEQCCYVMKKAPLAEYEKRTGRKPIIGTMACESMNRESAWFKNGCNAFDSKKARSAPMSFWMNQDVLHYIKNDNIPIASVYGEVVRADHIINDGVNQYEQMSFSDFGLIENGETEILQTTGCNRTGCMFCGFGCHMEKDGERRFERLKKTHPRQYQYCIGGGEYDENGVWKPNKKGLGLGHVFDELNKIYGDDFIKY